LIESRRGGGGINQGQCEGHNHGGRSKLHAEGTSKKPNVRTISVPGDGRKKARGGRGNGRGEKKSTGLKRSAK